MRPATTSASNPPSRSLLRLGRFPAGRGRGPQQAAVRTGGGTVRLSAAVVLWTNPQLLTHPLKDRRFPALSDAWQGAVSLAVGLIEPTELSLGPRCRGMLHELVLCLRILLLPDRCSGIFHRPDVHPCIMLAPHLCSGISQVPDLCSEMMLGPHMFAGIFHRPDRCPCIFLGRPSLK